VKENDGEVRAIPAFFISDGENGGGNRLPTAVEMFCDWALPNLAKPPANAAATAPPVRRNVLRV